MASSRVSFMKFMDSMIMVLSPSEKSGNSRSPILFAQVPMLIAMASALVRFRWAGAVAPPDSFTAFLACCSEFPEKGQHAPFLLLPGDFDENISGNRGVLAAGVPDLLGELVEREGERDGGLGFADDFCQLILLVAVVVHELFQGLGLLHGIEVLAQQVLHQCDLGVVVAFDEDGRDGGEARLPRRSAAPLTSDNIDQAGLRILPADDRYDDPVLDHGGGQFFEGHGVHVFTGLRRIGLKLGQRDLVELIWSIGRHDKFLLSDERKKG